MLHSPHQLVLRVRGTIAIGPCVSIIASLALVYWHVHITYVALLSASARSAVAKAQQVSWRNIPITLKTPGLGVNER